ncbi:MAG: hypothetical protein V2G33_03680 [bacterium JZ-2024 1]
MGKWRKAILWVILFVGVVAIWGASEAAIEPAPPPRPLERPMMPMGMHLTANSKYVYLVVGNTLFQLDAETLEVKKSVNVPVPPPPAPKG